MRPAYTAFLRGLRRDAKLAVPERIDLFNENLLFFVVEQLVKRRREHIARRAHAKVKIKRSHFPSVFSDGFTAAMWFIMFARYPAPKPLSILTAATPLAQELSIESSAESPPKEAP